MILNDIPSLTNASAITMLSFLLLLYSPSAILFNTCLSYIFDKMDSAQSIMPNITTWVGVIPFILVAVLDTFKWGKLFLRLIVMSSVTRLVSYFFVFVQYIRNVFAAYSWRTRSVFKAYSFVAYKQHICDIFAAYSRNIHRVKVKNMQRTRNVHYMQPILGFLVRYITKGPSQ